MSDKPDLHSDIYITVMKELIKNPDIEDLMDKQAKTALMRAILKQEKPNAGSK